MVFTLLVLVRFTEGTSRESLIFELNNHVRMHCARDIHTSHPLFSVFFPLMDFVYYLVLESVRLIVTILCLLASFESLMT